MTCRSPLSEDYCWRRCDRRLRLQDPSANATDAGTNTSTSRYCLENRNTWTYQGHQSTGDVSIKVNTPRRGADRRQRPFTTACAQVVTPKSGGTTRRSAGSSARRPGAALREQASRGYGLLELESTWIRTSFASTALRAHGAGFSWLRVQGNQASVGDTPALHELRSLGMRAVGESVTVPAGTFTDTVVLEKIGGSVLKTYWFARGVGKVKETGGQTEELVEYGVSP